MCPLLIAYWHTGRCLLSNLSLCNTFNLNRRAVTWRQRLQTRTRRHGLRQEIYVNLIHGSKVLHVSQVDIVFDYLVQ